VSHSYVFVCVCVYACMHECILISPYILTGGGGGGDIGGGGGAGGVVYQKKVSISAGTYTIVVGAGGAARPSTVTGVANSVDGNNGLPSRIEFNGVMLWRGGIAFEGAGGGGGGNYANR
jgi:hypothetical protein